MTHPRALITLTATVVLVLFGTACGKSNPQGDDLSRDLALAGSNNELELSPTAGHTDVVSAAERSPEKNPARAPSRRTTTYQHVANATSVAPVTARPAVTAAPVADPAPTAEPTPHPAPAAVTPAPSHRPMPRQTPPPGGYRTVGEVIRNAPFPINP